ncbi:protein shisa-5 isoform X2 [Solenopsis invicta]|uniref:protein shisa-5 isoform X2 n=1 Tax=Solenopsis invicta TaxID=13686 RepID=UPI000595ECF9|nr:protein shisa-5 isoform X2 [Solenopsis invicta]
MSRLAIGLLLVCLHAGSAYGLDCNYGSNKNFFENLLTTCPRLTDPQENSYCCYDFAHDRAYCCNFEEFTMKTGVGIIIPVVIAVAIVVGLVVCCISCLCCSCCPWYRRRQGTVYGIQTPIVQVIQPQSNLPPSYTNQPAQNYAPYPTGSTGMPQPPPYTNEAYAKQAPYNPAYPPPQ